MHTSRRNERGQIVVVVALALTILVAMAGVVIDGGMAWTNRRQVQNAADSAALAGARVLGLDVRWRASGSPNPPGAPFADADAEVCNAINAALGYNQNPGQAIPPIACDVGTPDAVYVNFDGDPVGQVGNGIPLTAQGVRVDATGQSATMLMSVVGISSIDVGAEAMALAGPAEPPLGKLMPFVVQNPLTPFVPGSPYEVRSESEGECGEAALDRALAEMGVDAGIVFASALQPSSEAPAPLAAKPLTPIADPGPQTFTASITVELSSPTNGAKLYYTTDGSTPTAASPEYKNTTDLTFTETTVLKAIAVKTGESSEVGTFLYTKAGPPPSAVTADPVSQTFTDPFTVTLTTATGGATVIYYTTDGTNPTTSSSIYTGPIAISTTTTLKAMAYLNLSPSAITSWVYTEDGETAAPTADPPDGTTFESGLTVTLATTTPGATIHYTTNGSDPTTSSPTYSSGIVLTGNTTIKAFATNGGVDSAIVSFTYTLTGPTCPDLTAGNFGWVDFSGGAGGNNELKNWVDDPSTAPGDWYYRNCAGAGDANCRDQHDVADPADDHWLLEGTTGHRQVTMEIACKYVGQEIYVPIWDGFETTTKKPNGSNAVFHLIGFAAFRLDGIIDTKNNGDPSGKGCGVQDIDGQSRPNEKGFIGTYVDSFIGTQVARCIIDPVTQNPCTNLNANTAFTINLAR